MNRFFCILICMLLVLVPGAALAGTENMQSSGFLADFACAYAQRIADEATQLLPDCRVYVQMSTQQVNSEQFDDAQFDALMAELDMDAHVRLLIEGDTLDIAILEELSGRLAQNGYHGVYSCCLVSDADRALQIIENEKQIEQQLFLLGIMQQYTRFQIDSGAFQGVQSEQLEKELLGVPFEVTTGVRIFPHDRYARNCTLMDVSRYEACFDSVQRISPVYMFETVGAGFMEIDLNVLGIDVLRPRLAILEWNYDAQCYEVKEEMVIVRDGVIWTNRIPAVAFCVTAG